MLSSVGEVSLRFGVSVAEAFRPFAFRAAATEASLAPPKDGRGLFADEMVPLTPPSTLLRDRAAAPLGGERGEARVTTLPMNDALVNFNRGVGIMRKKRWERGRLPMFGLEEDDTTSPEELTAEAVI